MYPGIIGNTHGDKKLINPAPNAKDNFMIMYSLYLPLTLSAITILTHDNSIYGFYTYSLVVFHLYKDTECF